MTDIVVGVIPRFTIWIMFAMWGKAPESVKVGQFPCGTGIANTHGSLVVY